MKPLENITSRADRTYGRILPLSTRSVEYILILSQSASLTIIPVAAPLMYGCVTYARLLTALIPLQSIPLQSTAVIDYASFPINARGRQYTKENGVEKDADARISSTCLDRKIVHQHKWHNLLMTF